MPNCFALYRLNDPKKTFVSLSKIDEEICEMMNVPCDEKKYYYGWYDIIGFRLAMGETFDDMISGNEAKGIGALEDPIYQQIARWLEANYGSDAWSQRGRY
jgi:hypothetical protein